MRPADTTDSALVGLWQRYRKGLRVAWYRDRVSPRILDSRPVVDTVDGACELHVLASRWTWLALLWTLKSFYRASKRRYRLCIHDDGSLDAYALGALANHFPVARILLRTAADAHAGTLLRDYPALAAFRRGSPLALQVTDFVPCLEAPQMLLLDSNVLFFSMPAALLARIEDPRFRVNAFNAALDSDYALSFPQAVQAYGVHLLPLIDAGLAIVQRDSIRLDWLESFLAVEPLRSAPGGQGVKTLLALCSSRFGAELLPGEYAQYLGGGLGERPLRLYAGASRHLFYREGIRTLSRSLLHH